MLQTMAFDSVQGNCPVYETAWTPNPDELARLNAGANIHVIIVGIAVQPMRVLIGAAPEDQPPKECEPWIACVPRLSPDGTYVIHKDDCEVAKRNGWPTESNPADNGRTRTND
jgi:hypothetical protein